MTSYRDTSSTLGSKYDTNDEDQTVHAITSVVESVQPTAASSKVWNTSELLEQILSTLSAKDLIAASDVNDTFYNCLINSPGLREKLWLPVKCKKPIERYEGLHIIGSDRCLQPIDLCPVLDLWDRNVMAYGPVYRVETQGNIEYTKLTRQPAKLRGLADMLLTDPWKHTST